MSDLKVRLYRCFYCDRTTQFPSRLSMFTDGKLICHDCREYELENGETR
jgi:superfamily II helicase